MVRKQLVTIAIGAVLAGMLSPGPARAQSNAAEPEESRFQKVLLDDDLGEAVRIDVAADGRVVLIERSGTVKVWDPDTQRTKVAGTVPTTVVGEVGLIGLALAPDFETSGHLYLKYAAPDWAQSHIDRVSRFTLGADNTLSLASEVKIIDSVNAGTGGHSGGDLEMTPDGLLFVSTGDNTNCCGSKGWAPHDERPGHAEDDAQRTSANTNSLNGKLLRIRPLPEGGYSIPDGNLFGPGGRYPGEEGKTRPEIYAMGFRNLFTIGDYDPTTGALWVADYGPDAAIDGPRGPKGYVRPILVTEPANYGWPYCTADNKPYTDWDYVNDVAKQPFDCENPVNDSPNNTGLVDLPPIKAANIYYSYSAEEPFPELHGGGPQAGPMYHYDAANPSPTKFPEWFDGRRFLMEFTTNEVHTVSFASDLQTPGDIQPFMPSMDFAAPFDARFGADGSLYLLEYGQNVFSSSIDGPGLYRIDYVEGNRQPLVRATSDRDSGALPLAVTFDASATTDPDGDALSFSWDLDGDGNEDATGPTASYTYTSAGTFAPRVTVTDSNGASAIGNLAVVAGNTRPTVTFESPNDGGFAEFGDQIPYRLSLEDPEDGSSVDCTKITVTYALGHNRHAHQTDSVHPNAQCEGVIEAQRDTAHEPSRYSPAYLFHQVTASYTDQGGLSDTPALIGSARLVLHPRLYTAAQAQDMHEAVSGLGQVNMGTQGAHIMFPEVNLDGIERMNFEVSTMEPGSGFAVHADSPSGPVITQFSGLPDTGTELWLGGIYEWMTATVTNPGGVHDLYIVADYPPGVSPGSLTLRDFEFITSPESVTATLSPASPDGNNGWYTSPVSIAIDTADAPLWSQQFSTDGGENWQAAVDGTGTIDSEGAISVLYRAIDHAGQIAAGGSIEVKIDTVAPETTASSQKSGKGRSSGRPRVTLTATDQSSGVASTEYRVDSGSWQTYATPFRARKKSTITYRSTDNAGNVETPKQLPLSGN